MMHAQTRSILAQAIFLASLVSCATTARLNEGDKLFEQGDFAGAVLAYENAAQESPDDVEVQRKWKTARVFANLDKGRKLVFDSRFIEAYNCFEEVLRIDPSNEMAPQWIESTRSKFVSQKVNEGYDLLAEENYSGASDSFQRALIYDPQNDGALAGLERIRNTLDVQLAKADNYLLRGVRDKAADLIEQASANFQKSMDLNPADPEARKRSGESRHQLAEQKFLAAQLLEREGNLGAALVQFRAIRAIEPDFQGLAERVGQLEVEIKAQELLSRAKRLLARGDFANTRAALEEARKLATAPATTKAIEELLKDTQDKELSALYVAGRGMEQVSRFQEAVEKYEAVLKIASSYEDTIARLDLVRAAVSRAGEIYDKALQTEEGGDKAAALQMYQDIYSFYPRFRDVAARIEKLRQP